MKIRVRDHILFVLAAIVVVSNAAGNFLLRIGLRSKTPLLSFSLADYLKALSHPAVILGVVLLFGWFILDLTLLSWADLTYVLPVTSLSYVLIAFAGAWSLHEHVSPAHWCGIAMIVGGAVLASRTRPLTPGSGLKS